MSETCKRCGGHCYDDMLACLRNQNATLREQLAEAKEREGLNDDRAAEWQRMYNEDVPKARREGLEEVKRFVTEYTANQIEQVTMAEDTMAIDVLAEIQAQVGVWVERRLAQHPSDKEPSRD